MVGMVRRQVGNGVGEETVVAPSQKALLYMASMNGRTKEQILLLINY